MPPRPFVNDALWRCLCPGFPPSAPRSALAKVGAVSAVRRGVAKRRSTAAQLRSYSQSPAASPYNDSFFSQTTTPSFADARPTKPRAFANQGDKPPLVQLPTHILYEHLRNEGAKGNFDDVFQICRILVKDRGETPNTQMYNGILHSFASAANGTAGKVRKVLDEMGFWEEGGSFNGRTKIELDARGCECVLEVLAVHPDYLLRVEILEYMKTRWFPLSDRGQNYVVAGMLRERHFEQALEWLEDMLKTKTKVEGWLFDKALWMLLEFGEVEEAFYVLSLKSGAQGQNNGTGSVTLSNALWGAMLDAAAKKQLYDPVNLIWNTRIQPGYLKPGTGACLSILALAARHGDVHLATDVFRVLTERETIFASHHYELLVTTYLNADDLPSALSIIMIMVDAKLKVTTETCQPLFLYMRQEIPNEANRPIAAFNLLQDLEASGRKVPTAAINACMQASIALDRFEEAIEIYKALHTVSHAGPDTQTFNILFKGCHEKGRKELAMFFANEMIQLGLRPDRLTYDRLICVCMQGDDWEDALKYYEEMRSTPAKPGSEEKMQPRKKTWEGMIFKAIGKDDVRVVALLKDYMEHQEEPRIALERAVRQRFEEGRPVRRDDGVAEEGRDVAGPVQEQTYEQQPPLTEKDQRAKDAADVYEQLMGGQK